MQEVRDNISEITEQEKNAVRNRAHHNQALKNAAKNHDKAEFTKQKISKSAQKKELMEKHRLKRNEDFYLLIRVLVVFLIFDFATREILFQYSLPHLKMIEQNRSDVLNKVFAGISELADKYAYVVIIGATYHFFDVPNAFVVTCTIYTTLGILSISKSFFHEARPFFIADITPTKCWLEYGNPSGHSISSSALYLTIWDLICRNFKAERKTRFISLALTLLTLFLIAFSRIYNGVHTYNQIMLGWIMGVSLYFFFCHVVYNDLIRFVSSTHKKSWCKLIFNKGTMVFYTIYSIAYFNFLFGNDIHPQPELWNEQIRKNCAAFGIVSYDDPETENFIRFNLASTIAGSYIGLIVEQRWMGTRKYKIFNQTKPFTTMKRVIFCTFVGCPLLCGIILCPSQGVHWTTKLLFKTVIPITLGNCYLYMCSKYVALKANLINATVDESDSTTTSASDEALEKSKTVKAE